MTAVALAFAAWPGLGRADAVALVAGGEAWTGLPFPTRHEHRHLGGSLDLLVIPLEGYERVGFGIGGYALRGDTELDAGGGDEKTEIYGGRLSVTATSTGFGFGFGLIAEAGISPMYAEVADNQDWVLGFHARLGLGGILGPLLWRAEAGVLSAQLSHPSTNLGGLAAMVGLGWNLEGHAATAPDGDGDGDDDEHEPGISVDVPRRVPVPPGGVTLLVRVTPRGDLSGPVLVSVRSSPGVRWELLPPRAEDPEAWELRIDHVPRNGGTIQIRAAAGSTVRTARVELYRGFEEE